MIWLAIALIVLGLLITKRSVVSILQVIQDWQNTVSVQAEKFTVPFQLVLAVIVQESGGDPQATGRTGDYGLMQITAPTLTDFNKVNNKSYTLADMYDPIKNVEVGTWYLSWLHNTFSLSWRDTLRAYNVGIGTVLKSTTAGSSYADSVISYSDKILDNLFKLEE